MAETKTLAEAESLRRETIENNRDHGVVAYKTKEPQVSEVYEVIEGYHHLPGGIKLGPGNRFHPTQRQVAGLVRGKGGLTGKVRELARSEYRDLRRERPATTPGADIGLRQFPMAEGTFKYAQEQGLDESWFEGVQPAGADGQFTRRQVEEMVDQKKAGDTPE